MKITKIIIIAFVTLLSLEGCVLPICGCSPPPTNREFLLGNWISTYVSLDEQDLTSDWQEFNVQFNWENYNTESSGNLVVWPESGSYNFAGENGSNLDVIERNDRILVNIDYISDSELQLSLIEATSGSWTFMFSKSQ